MPSTIADILSLLEIVKSYSTNGPASRGYVVKTFNDLPIKKMGGPNYHELERLCVDLGLLLTVDDTVSTTQLGDTFGAYSANDRDLPNTFIRKAILGPGTGKRVLSALSAFLSDGHDTYWYPKNDVYDLFSSPSIMPILYETKLLEKDGSRVIINPEHAGLVPRRISQEALENQLARRKKIGDMGEKIALEFERARLAAMGRRQEASNVKLLSAEFVNAGYDMESFDLGEDGEIHRIYVEIKSSTGRKIDFHWSANELRQAEIHAENYWIYFVPNIDEQTESSDTPVRIQNPYRTVFCNSSFKTEPSQYRSFDRGATDE